MLKCPRIVHDSAIQGLLMDVRVIESIREQPAKSCLDFTMVGHLSNVTGRSVCCHKSSSNCDMQFRMSTACSGCSYLLFGYNHPVDTHMQE